MGDIGLGGLFRQSEAERKIWHMPVDSLIKEYELIKDKKSNLSRRERDMVEARVQYIMNHLRKNGVI